MKKIDGGFGKDIEVSDDIADDVDPESMLADPIPEAKKTQKQIPSESIPEDQIVTIGCFATPEGEFQVTGLLRKITISNNNLEYEFLMLKRHLFSLLKITKIELHKIIFLLGDQQEEFSTGIRVIKKIEFESYGKKIGCRVFA